MNRASRQHPKRPVYPTWIRFRRIVVFWVVAVGMVVLGIAVAFFWLPGLAITLLAMPFLYIAIILTWTSHQLGPHGGNVQSRIHQLLLDSVGTEGRLLDVGCGSGQLLIRCAQSAQGDYVGLDYGGDDWEYSRAQAERNAALEGVQGLRFVRGSASRLPFADADFTRVVSALTFHEVRDVAEKTSSVAEALRVLEPGGRFAFIDLFDDPDIYDTREHVLKVITSNGGEIESARSLSDVLELRFPLNLAQALKYAVLVSGTKSFAVASDRL
jgi:SAM-dependent methyltransferase